MFYDNKMQMTVHLGAIEHAQSKLSPNESANFLFSTELT